MTRRPLSALACRVALAAHLGVSHGGEAPAPRPVLLTGRVVPAPADGPGGYDLVPGPDARRLKRRYPLVVTCDEHRETLGRAVGKPAEVVVYGLLVPAGPEDTFLVIRDVGISHASRGN
jgi:hypothetical protein